MRTGTRDSVRTPTHRIEGELRALQVYIDELKRDKERLVRDLATAADERRQLLTMLETKDRLLEDARAWRRSPLFFWRRREP